MAMFKCKICGGDLEITDAANIAICEYCGTKQTIPDSDDEKKLKLFNRANRMRIACDFDKAAGLYETIISEFPQDAESYWGNCLCKYGIEYVDDPVTAKKVPTCHRTQTVSIFDDPDFKQAIAHANLDAQYLYRQEAQEIDRLQKAILDIVKNEAPYDVFICYKETDENGRRSKDSVQAQNIYDELTEKGYKVFFSRITLENRLGQEYEPYIYAALNTAKILLAVGTNPAHFGAVWVKNEWSRFLSMMKADPEKRLIPCYSDMDPYDMPPEFSNLQGQDMNKIGFLQDLYKIVSRILPKEQEETAFDGRLGGQVGKLLEEGYKLLKITQAELDGIARKKLEALGDDADAKWDIAMNESMCESGREFEDYLLGDDVDEMEKAVDDLVLLSEKDDYFEKMRGVFEEALNEEPECAEAYFGLFCATYYFLIGSQEEFLEMVKDKVKDYPQALTTDENFQSAKDYAEGDFKEWLLSVEKQAAAYLSRLGNETYDLMHSTKHYFSNKPFRLDGEIKEEASDVLMSALDLAPENGEAKLGQFLIENDLSYRDILDFDVVNDHEKRKKLVAIYQGDQDFQAAFAELLATASRAGAQDDALATEALVKKCTEDLQNPLLSRQAAEVLAFLNGGGAAPAWQEPAAQPMQPGYQQEPAPWEQHYEEPAQPGYYEEPAVQPAQPGYYEEPSVQPVYYEETASQAAYQEEPVPQTQQYYEQPVIQDDWLRGGYDKAKSTLGGFYDGVKGRIDQFDEEHPDYNINENLAKAGNTIKSGLGALGSRFQDLKKRWK